MLLVIIIVSKGDWRCSSHYIWDFVPQSSKRTSRDITIAQIGCQALGVCAGAITMEQVGFSVSIQIGMLLAASLQKVC